MNLLKFARLIEWVEREFPDNPFLNNLSKYAQLAEWMDRKYGINSFETNLLPNQISSKHWMVSELAKIPQVQGPWPTPNGLDNEGNTIEIVGSWFGYPLIDMLEDKLNVRKIECWDIDFKARQVAEQYVEIFKPRDVKIYSQDYFNHGRDGSAAHLIINTSSEHMKETFWMMDDLYGEPREHLKGKQKFYMKGTCLAAVQSNNMRHLPEHINCVHSVDELVEKHKFENVFYSGYQDMVEWRDDQIRSNGFKRFLVIGKIDAEI